MRFITYTNGGHGSRGFDLNSGSIPLPLRLITPPTVSMEAVTRGYVEQSTSNLNADNIVGVFNSGRLPAFTGSEISSAGGGVFTLAPTGVTPGAYGKVTVDSKGRVTGGSALISSDIPTLNWNKVTDRPSSLSGYGITDTLSLINNVMTGALVISPPPIYNNHLANKQYVDNKVIASSGSAFVTGDTIIKNVSTTPIGFLRCNGSAVDKTTYASLYAVLGDRFNPNSVLGANTPWKNQYNFNFNRQDDISGWVSSGTLSLGKSHAEVFVSKNKIFILGGNTTVSVNTVHSANILSDGTLSTWSAGANLPGVLSKSQLVVTTNRAYLLGGANGATSLNVIYTATIDVNGTLSSFTSSGTLPQTLHSSRAFVTRSRVYLLGGMSAGVASNKVFSAPINLSGTLGSWTQGTNLPEAVYEGQVISTLNRVYLIGGHNGASKVNKIHTAVINPDGTLGSWTSNAGSGSSGISTSALLAGTNYTFLGGNENNVISDTNYTIGLNPNVTNVITATVPSGGFLTYEYQNTVTVSAQVFNTGTINIPANALSISVTAKGGDGLPYAAAQGGNPEQQATTGADTTVVYNGVTKTFNGGIQTNATPSTQTFTPSGSSMTIAFNVGAPSGYVSYSYVIPGGIVNQTLNSSGSVTLPLGTSSVSLSGRGSNWLSGLPEAIQGHVCLINNKRAYVLGGVDSDRTFSADISEFGLLGQWVENQNLPAVLGNAQLAVTSSNAYLIGGSNAANATVNTIYKAPFIGGSNDYTPYFSTVFEAMDPNKFCLPDTSAQDRPGLYSYIKI